MDFDLSVSKILAVAIPVIIAITLHEAAHGFVAWRLGDDTAYRQGRVTFNPLKHIDAFGTILLPAMLIFLRAPFVFGWAKPVPVNFGRLRRPRRDMVLVAAAGPGTNLALAWISGVLIHVAGQFPAPIAEWLSFSLSVSIVVNAILAVFNMIPLPPLDGGRVAVGLLPEALAIPLARLERWGILVLIGILFVVPALAREIGYDLSLFTWIVLPLVDIVIDAIEALTGATVHF
jgi:Zn-dependent protease